MPTPARLPVALLRAFVAVAALAIAPDALALRGDSHFDTTAPVQAIPAGTTAAPWELHLWHERFIISLPDGPIPNATVVVTVPQGCGQFVGVAPGTATFTVTTDQDGRASLPPFAAGPLSASCSVGLAFNGDGTGFQSVGASIPVLVVAPGDVFGTPYPSSTETFYVTTGNTYVTTQPSAQFSVRMPDGQAVGLFNESVQFDFPPGCGNTASVTTLPGGVAQWLDYFGSPGTPRHCSITASLSRFGVSTQVEVEYFDPAALKVAPASLSVGIGETITFPLTVTLADGRPLPGAAAHLSVQVPLAVSPGPFKVISGCCTDAAGQVTGQLTGGTAQGGYTMDVVLSGTSRPPPYGALLQQDYAHLEIPVTQHAAPVAPAQPRLELASGDNQVAPVGTPLPEPLRMRASASDGQPIANATVEFIVDPDGPTGVFATTASTTARAITDAAGWAQVAFTPTAGVGQGTIHARILDSAGQPSVSTALHFTSTFANGATSAQLSDMWWNPAESGWGLAIAQGKGSLFNVIYTYDAAGQPTWYAVTSGAWTTGFASTNVGDLFSPRGSWYAAYDPSKFKAGEPVSSFAAKFASPDEATLQAPVLGSAKALRRYVFGDRAQPTVGVGGLWWGGAAQNGWGLTVSEQGGKLFVAWYTYDADGKPLWFTMSDGQFSNATTWTGPVYRSTRSASGAVATTSVGSFSLAFSGTDKAQFTFDVQGHHGSVPISKYAF